MFLFLSLALTPSKAVNCSIQKMQQKFLDITQREILPLDVTTAFVPLFIYTPGFVPPCTFGKHRCKGIYKHGILTISLVNLYLTLTMKVLVLLLVGMVMLDLAAPALAEDEEDPEPEDDGSVSNLTFTPALLSCGMFNFRKQT